MDAYQDQIYRRWLSVQKAFRDQTKPYFKNPFFYFSGTCPAQKKEPFYPGKFPRPEWRKFRNTYATILSDYNVHIKTISQCLGHYSPDLSVKEPVVYDISQAIGEYVSTNRLLPVPRSRKEADVYMLPEDSAYREYFFE